MAETASIFNMLKAQPKLASTPGNGIMQIMNELRALAVDPRAKDDVITLETLAYFAERLVAEFAPLEAIVPNAIDAVDVNDKPAVMDGRTVKLEIPTRVSQLDDAGSYLHIKALRDELDGYVRWGDLPETILTQEEKDKLDSLPNLHEKAGKNTVSLNEEGKLEVESLSPDKIDPEGFAFLLDCGRPYDTTIEVLL